MLVPDVPTPNVRGYTPENFNEDFSGRHRSLKKHWHVFKYTCGLRILQFHGFYKKNFRDNSMFWNSAVNKNLPNHYGLTLILGGAESNLWDLCKTYAKFGPTVGHFNASSKRIL